MHPNRQTKEEFHLGDILFIFFRHKWKILLLTLSGFAAAAAVYANRVPLYESRAKLLVRYVLERSAVDPYEAQKGAGAGAGDQAITAEVEILSSEDLAAEVVGTIGAGRIFGDPAMEASEAEAAALVMSGLEVGAAKGSNVIHVVYRNPDPDLSVSVLRKLVESYFERHLQIHRSIGTFEFVSKQTDQARNQLRETEAQLNKLKLEAGIMSLERSTDTLEAQRGRIETALMAAEAGLLEQRARLGALEREYGVKSGSADSAATPPETSGDLPTLQARAAALAEYQGLTERLNFLGKQRMELLSKYTAANPQVVAVDRQISEVKAQGLRLVDKHPELLAQSSGGDGSTRQGLDLATERASLAAAVARRDVLLAQLKALEDQVKGFSATREKIAALERRKDLEEEKYRYLESSLEKARVDEALDPSKIPNISVVQQPSTPIKTYADITNKIMLGLAGSGLMLGLGLAFLIEMVFDRRVKRSVEIETKLQLPLLISIPYVRPKRHGNLLYSGDYGSGEAVGKGLPGPGDGGRRRNDHFMMPYAKAIRDRLVFNFEVNNITHKPKIVGITSLSEGAGASTVAAGLAAALADTRGLKVLLVDLNGRMDGARTLPGKRLPGPISGALKAPRGPNGANGHGGLYITSASARADDADGAEFAPMNLFHLMPQFRSSDYDYIIFDLPSVEPTSPTLVMGGMMDKVLLVLDAENTPRETLKWGYSQLTKGHADVSCVFNKTRVQAPAWVLGEV